MSSLIPNYDGQIRRVLFDSRNIATAVQSANRYGPSATTYQLEERSLAYTLSSSKNVKIVNPYVFISDGVNFSGTWANGNAMTSSDIRGKLGLIAKELYQYLIWQGNGLLPAGYGWDGKHTNFELLKAGRVKQLIIGENDFKDITNEDIDSIAESVMTSKNENLMLDWKEAIPFSENIFPQPRNHDSQLFVFYQNDSVSVKVDCGDILNQNHLSLSPPKEYDRVVVIVTKFNTSPRYPNFGASIELFKRKSNYDT